MNMNSFLFEASLHVSEGLSKLLILGAQLLDSYLIYSQFHREIGELLSQLNDDFLWIDFHQALGVRAARMAFSLAS